MTEKLRFIVAAEAEEESLALLCRQFGISRKTGYKWLARYRAEGASGLDDRSRAPQRRPQAVSAAVRERLLAVRGAHPSWGPKKIVAWLARQQPQQRWPATSTVGVVLQQAGLVVPRRRRTHAPPRTQPLAHATAPNVVWCADFKGDFLLGDGSRCYPLTISDAHSRLLLRCQALTSTAHAGVQPLFAATFREYGLPDVLRSDNGVPFASRGVAGLSRLSVWWLQLGIRPERITPGTPSENGRHERMHRTLKAEACRVPGFTLAAQQRQFDAFRREYNAERPHEALGQATPASVHVPSPRLFPERLPAVEYPGAEAVRRVRPHGALRWHGEEVYLTEALAGQPVGFWPAGDGLWELRFCALSLGVLDERTGRLQHAAAVRDAPAEETGDGLERVQAASTSVTPLAG